MPARPFSRERLRQMASAMASKAATVFIISVVACGAIAIWGVIDPESLGEAAREMTGYGLSHFDWLFLATATMFLVVGLALAFGPFGRLKLGKPNEEPEFSTVSWLAMLFAAGMGAGLLFWGAAEPLTHYTTPPPGAPEDEGGRARWAMVVTNLHWGLHAWGIYAMGALVLAYFAFRKGQPLLPGTPFRVTLPGRPGRLLGDAADVIAVLSVVFGVVGSLCLGIMQIVSGMSTVFGTPTDSALMQLAVLVVLTLCYLLSAGTSLDKGIQILSNLNMGTAVLLMLFLLFFGPTQFILSTFLNSTGDYLINIIPLSTRLFSYSGETEWSQTWTLTYFIWWISWAPFVGIFVARISRGRTIRQFIAGVIMVPTAFSLLWFAVFGGTGLHVELFGDGSYGTVVAEDVSEALFVLFEYFPASALLSVVALFLIFMFLVTSADSASFVLGMVTSGGDENPAMRRKLTWGLIVSVLTAATLFAGGGVHVVRAIAISGAIPFTIVMLGQVSCMIRSIFHDHTAVAPNPEAQS